MQRPEPKLTLKLLPKRMRVAFRRGHRRNTYDDDIWGTYRGAGHARATVVALTRSTHVG